MPLPQRIAAVPQYICSTNNGDLADAAPGHRFLLYLRYWQGTNGNPFSVYKSVRPQGREERQTFTDENAGSLKEVCSFGPSARNMLGGLRARQRALIDALGADGLVMHAESTAPFATGLGNEHPIENGFAFLTPYGLPYLAGSGTKGVLRHAAEKLALFPHEYAIGTSAPDATVEASLTILDVWWLFGFEGAAGAIWEPASEYGRAFAASLAAIASREDLPQFIAKVVTDRKARACYLDAHNDGGLKFLQKLQQDRVFRQSLAYRGALDCWDVFPAPPDSQMTVEIMTPHHAGYYTEGKTPHDGESPIPVPFLAVPAKSLFDFHVVCASDRLPEAMRSAWAMQMQRFFRHAFDWLGFGAKTSVGYGAMAEAEGDSSAVTQKTAAPARVPVAEVVWDKAQIKFNARNGSLTATSPNRVEAVALAPLGADLLASLPLTTQQKVRQNAYVRVRATVVGTELMKVEPAA